MPLKRLFHGSLGETTSIDYGVMCDTTVSVNRSVMIRSKTKSKTGLGLASKQRQEPNTRTYQTQH